NSLSRFFDFFGKFICAVLTSYQLGNFFGGVSIVKFLSRSLDKMPYSCRACSSYGTVNTYPFLTAGFLGYFTIEFSNGLINQVFTRFFNGLSVCGISIVVTDNEQDSAGFSFYFFYPRFIGNNVRKNAIRKINSYPFSAFDDIPLVCL